MHVLPNIKYGNNHVTNPRNYIRQHWINLT